MHERLSRRLWLVGWVAALLLASGCFQPAGGGLEATNANQAQPTFTLFPSDTPLPAPTDTPVLPSTEIAELPSATFAILAAGTPVAQAGIEQLDPIFETATAVYLLGQPVQVIPLEAPTESIQSIDPLLQTATALVAQATNAAGAPLTQTAAAIFGPSPTPIFIAPTAAGPVPSGADCVYEVQTGDPNLFRISLKFGIPYMSIATATHLVNPNLIHVGDRLIIPGCGTTGYVPPPTSTPGTSGGSAQGAGSGQTYVVVAGDTLYALSIKWGTTINAIASLNQIQNVNLIFVGQTLNIP